MEFENDNIKIENYPTLSKSEVKNVLFRCQQLVKTSNRFQTAVMNMAQSWQELTDDLDKIFNLKEMYFISNILNSDKDVQYILSENQFYSAKLKELNDFLSSEYIIPIKTKTEELQKKVSNKKVEKALKNESKNRKRDNYDNSNSNTNSLVQKSIFNNNYEIFRCVVNSSNNLIKYIENLFVKSESNSSKHHDAIKNIYHKKSYSSSNVSPSDLKSLNNNSTSNSKLSIKPLNKSYLRNNSFSFNLHQNSKKGTKHSSIENIEPVKLEKSYASIPNYNNKDQNSNNRNSTGPLSPLNKELQIDFGVSEIPNRNKIEKLIVNDNDNDEIIVPPNGITSPYLGDNMATMNDNYKSFKKKQRMLGHNRSHSVGADPFNNSSAMAQEKYLNLINGSNPVSSTNNTNSDSPFMFPNTTTNINTSSKIPSLTSIIDTPPVTDSNTPSLECVQSNSQAQANPSHILNMLTMDSRDHFNKKSSNPDMRSYMSSSNFPSVSSINFSYIEKVSNKMNDKSFVENGENESFSISQSTIKIEDERKDTEHDSIFDHEISFNNNEDDVGEIIEINSEDMPPLGMSDGVDDIDVDVNKNRVAKMKNQNSSLENDYIYINENEGEKINKIEIVEIEVDNETDTHDTDNATEIVNGNNIEDELEDEIIDEFDMPSILQQQKPVKEIQEIEEVVVIEEEIIEDEGGQTPTIPYKKDDELLSATHKSSKSNSSGSHRNGEIKSSKSTKMVRSPDNTNIDIKSNDAKNGYSPEQVMQEITPPPELNKTDLNINIQKMDEKTNVKRSKSINIFKSHERSRSLDMKFDKKHILGIIFNKKDSSSSKKSSNPPPLPPKSSSSIKKSNTTKSTKSTHSNAASDTKSVHSNASDGNTNNGYKIPDFNFNGFIKSNSPIVNRKLQRRHSISSPEKTDLDPTIYNSNTNPTSTINRHGTVDAAYTNNQLHRSPMPIEKDNEKISVEEIQASLFNVSSLSSDHSSHSLASSSSSSRLRRERLKLGIQGSPRSYKSNGSTTPTAASPKKKLLKEEDEKLQLLKPITTTPILENAINKILDKELPKIKMLDESQDNSQKKHDTESPDIIQIDNLPIYNSTDIANIPIYTESEILVQTEDDEEEEETEMDYMKTDNNRKTDESQIYDDKSNGSIMALINKNWKLLSEDLSEENLIKPTSKSSKNKTSSTKKDNKLKPQLTISNNKYLDSSNNMDNISPILPPLSKTLNINIGNAFATVENEYLEKKSPKKEDFISGSGNINHHNNTQYKKCMDNLGNPFLNPNNGLEISENEAYKGKATICSPNVEVESIIGSILDVNDPEEDDNENDDYNDNDEAFEKNLQNYRFTAITTDNKRNDKSESENKENENMNIMNNPFIINNKTPDKSQKSSHVVSSVTSFRKYSLPTSNLSKPPNDENKYLQRSRSGNSKNAFANAFTPLSSHSNNNNSSNSNSNSNNNSRTHYSENNSSNPTFTNSNSNSSSRHKNKKYERIMAIHDYSARDNREMSLEKGDVLIVKQRKGTWIYGVKESNIFKIDLITNQQIKFDHHEHGWVPATYIKPYTRNNS